MLKVYTYENKKAEIIREEGSPYDNHQIVVIDGDCSDAQVGTCTWRLHEGCTECQGEEVDWEYIAGVLLDFLAASPVENNCPPNVHPEMQEAQDDLTLAENNHRFTKRTLARAEREYFTTLGNILGYDGQDLDMSPKECQQSPTACCIFDGKNDPDHSACICCYLPEDELDDGLCEPAIILRRWS